jgi:hypothetical protein
LGFNGLSTSEWWKVIRFCTKILSFHLIIVLLLKTYMYVSVVECIYLCIVEVKLFINFLYVYFVSCINGFRLEISLADIIITWRWHFLNKIRNAISNYYIITTFDSLNCLCYCLNVHKCIDGCACLKEEDQVDQDSYADPNIYGWWYMLHFYKRLLYLVCLLLCIYFSLLGICLLYCVWTLYLYLLLCRPWHLCIINAQMCIYYVRTYFFYIYLIEVYTVALKCYEGYLLF